MNYEPDESDYIGTTYPQPQQKKQQYIKLGIGIASVVILIALAFILGYVAAMYVHNEDELVCEDGSSPTAAPEPGTANDEDWDVNQRYFENSQPHPFSIHDLIRTDRLGEPVPSNDGKKFVFTRYVFNPETNKTSTTLWLRSLENLETTDDTTLIPLTPFGWGISEANPCFSLDGNTLLFISNRDPENIHHPGHTSQVWQVRVPSDLSGDVEDPEPLTSYPTSVNNLKCSSTRAYLAVGMNIVPGLTLEESAERVKQAESGALRGFVYEKLLIRHWGEWFHGERSHPFIQAITWDESSGKASTHGDAVDVLEGLDTDAPTKPFGGIEEWDFCPGDQEFAFTRRYDETSEAAWTTNLDLFTAKLSTDPETGAQVELRTESITVSNNATDTEPQYSPDGKWIAYRSTTRFGYESDQYVIRLYNRETGELSDLEIDWTHSIDSFTWSPDSLGFYITVGIDATTQIHYVQLADPAQSVPLVVNRSSSSVSVLSDAENKSTHLLFGQDCMMSPKNFFTVNLPIEDPSNLSQTKLTNFNDDMLSKVFLSKPEYFSFEGAGNDTVYGWILKPTEGNESGDGKFPLATLIHGGPQSSWNDNWSYRWNPQTYAAHGYATVVINFHGSTTYGQPFVDSIIADYGGKPFDDIHLGLDHVIANYDFVDGTRQVALGASYGGWMINWINGHNWTGPGNWTEPEEGGATRFLALVCHDGIFDQRQLYFDTEELWFPEHDMMGTPWESEYYEEWNPSTNAHLWVTPTLTIHGGRDFRIPDTHGINAFTVLQRNGIDSKFLYFPDEDHWVLSPHNSVLWHTTVQDWIDKYAKN